jgi:hypothetical protein
MSLNSQHVTEELDARLAEELEERTEFTDWLSVLTSCCGGGGTSGGGTVACSITPSSPNGVCTTAPTSNGSSGWCW